MNCPEQITFAMEPVKVRRSDPATSKAAAAKLNNAGMRAKILSLLKEHGGELATFQIAQKLGKGRDVISPHMRPLERLGFIVENGVVLNAETNCESTAWCWTGKVW